MNISKTDVVRVVAGMAIGLGSLAPVMAATRDLAIRDYTGWGFAPDRVQYSLTLPKGGAEALRLAGPDGKPVALQVAPPAEKGKPATLSFVAEVPPNGNAIYTLRDDGQGAVPPTSVKTATEGKALVLSSDLLAVKVPAPTDQVFKTPVAISSLPAAVLAFRNGNGPWLGEARILSGRKVKRFHVEQTASGPVYAEVRCEYTFDNDGYYRADVRVVDHVPLAVITEEYDAKELNGRDYWELDLGKGWSPDMLEAPREGRAILSVADLLKLRPVLGTMGSAGQVTTGKEPDLGILPGYCWLGNGAYYVGMWSGAERQANSNAFTRVAMLPLHKGAWRMSVASEFSVDGPAMRLKLPISARYANWHEDGASQTSPFSIGQHDPNLPRTLGRRVWGLVLAPCVGDWLNRSVLSGGYSVPWNKQPSTFWRTRNWYGTVGLDRYKDYILDWPDKHVGYPRVFLTPAEQERYKAAGTNVPLYGQVKARWGLSGDPEAAKREASQFNARMADLTHGFLDVIAVGHHDQWGVLQSMADDVLAWPDLPPAVREEIRARLALGAYLWVEPDLMSAGVGDHTGNPNMSTSRQQSYANFMALLPDHPMYEAWKRYMSEFTLYKIGENMSPGGGWFEFGCGYHVHGFYAFPRGFMGHQAAQSPCVDPEFQYLKADMEYVVNLLTPFDNRFGARMIPGGANSSIGYFHRWLEWVGAVERKDADLASMLMWAHDVNGRNDMPGDSEIETMNRPWVQAKEPVLTSRIYPGVGVVFRAHQGPDETYMFFRSGNNWSHWSCDQGQFILNSKGAVLVPSQTIQYLYAAKKDFPIYSVLHFGHPENDYSYGWPDSNILDHHFDATVDYAWSSSGYPDWYIHPQRAPGFGGPLKLLDGIEQKEGEFYWNRQILFLKGKTAQSPNYFVIHDTMPGEGRLASWLNLDLLGRTGDVRQTEGHIAVNTEWPVKLDLVFVQEHPLKLDMSEDQFPLQFAAAIPEPLVKAAQSVKASPNWVQNKEQRVLLRLANAPGADYLWMVYPREEHEALPPIARLAPNVVKVTTTESTDYVFVSPTNFTFEGEGIVFNGCAGAVRVGRDTVTLNLSGGAGHVGYKGYEVASPVPFERTVKLSALKPAKESIAAPRDAVAYKPQLKDHQPLAAGVVKAVAGDRTEYLVDGRVPAVVKDGPVAIEAGHGAIAVGPQGIRFVVTDRQYAQLTVGTVGVRGLGPFDLTFTSNNVTGRVDGDTRTLAVTRPAAIGRPMYHMDGMRYYAGYADDSAPDDNQPKPQFNLAFGVVAGKHDVDVSEWTYPALPPVPSRRGAE